MTKWQKAVIWLFVLAFMVAAGFGGYRYWNWRKAKMAKMTAAGGMSGMGGPMPLPVAQCTIQDVTDALEFTGNTEAVESVDIRARVEGYLEGIHFTDGALVEAGQLLFTIEPKAFRSRRDEAAANLKAAEAEMQRAKLDLERMQKAIESGAVSQQDLTGARTAFDTAEASVLARKALLENAELNLSYTEIRSPIAGRIGRRLVDIGNLVGAGNQTVLASVMRIQPIYVYFYMGEHLLGGDLLRRLQGGPDGDPLRFSVGLAEETDYSSEGFLDFLDNTVDPATGTVYVRGQVPNDSQVLLPGMFVRVRVPTAVRKDAVLIPEKAISTDLGGKYLLVVGEGNVLQRRDIKLGSTVGQLRVVTDGLDGTETFIVSGFHLARPSMPITPVPAGAGPPGAPPMPQAAEQPAQQEQG
jgi:RND family efflux transporter MFP subunit